MDHDGPQSQGQTSGAQRRPCWRLVVPLSDGCCDSGRFAARSCFNVGVPRSVIASGESQRTARVKWNTMVINMWLILNSAVPKSLRSMPASPCDSQPSACILTPLLWDSSWVPSVIFQYQGGKKHMYAYVPSQYPSAPLRHGQVWVILKTKSQRFSHATGDSYSVENL